MHICATGLIQNAEPDMINLVASLVETYVGDESTLILVTIPANGKLSTSITHGKSSNDLLQMIWRINKRCVSPGQLIPKAGAL